MYNLFLAIEKNDLKAEDLPMVNKQLHRCFKNRDYLDGYVDGYGFGKMFIFNPQQIDTMHNKGELQRYYLFTVTVNN